MVTWPDPNKIFLIFFFAKSSKKNNPLSYPPLREWFIITWLSHITDFCSCYKYILFFLCLLFSSFATCKLSPLPPSTPLPYFLLLLVPVFLLVVASKYIFIIQADRGGTPRTACCMSIASPSQVVFVVHIRSTLYLSLINIYITYLISYRTLLRSLLFLILIFSILVSIAFAEQPLPPIYWLRVQKFKNLLYCIVFIYSRLVLENNYDLWLMTYDLIPDWLRMFAHDRLQWFICWMWCICEFVILVLLDMFFYYQIYIRLYFETKPDKYGAFE